MVAVAPFRALRYNLERIGDLSAVVAPPYDVISSEAQAALYEASPYNIVRLILGKQFPDDTDTSSRYTRAKATFDEWRASGVLIEDRQPAIYLCEQTFTWEGQTHQRLGFIALLMFNGSVSPTGTSPGHVLKHEATFSAPKADRTKLIDAVQANLSPIFCIVPDTSQGHYGQMRALAQRQAPLASIRVPAKTPGTGWEQIRFWAIQDPTFNTALQEGLAPARALIADGHHRFEVALSRRHLAAGVMAYFAWREDPAVVVRPIHRVVRVEPAMQNAWRSRLEAACHLQPVGSLAEAARGAGGQGRFGYYEQGRWSLASVKDDVLADWLLHPSVPLALAGLDVSILHQFLIPQLMGGSQVQAASADSFCRYTPDASEAVAMVGRGKGTCAWLLRGIPLDQVFALAEQGIALPQKSTYFYPKVLSGLCLFPFH